MKNVDQIGGPVEAAGTARIGDSSNLNFPASGLGFQHGERRVDDFVNCDSLYFRFVEREDWLALEDKLARSELHPRFVFYDQHLRALPRNLRNFFQQHYVPLREGSRMLVRLPQSEDLPWSDEGRRWLVPQVEPLGTPYLLVENGWSQPERDDDRSFRLGRGKRSRLLLPVAKPRDFDLAIHAALEFQHPVSVSLSVNGESLGTRQLEAGWGDYHFDVAGRFWQRGINEVLLTYSTTPYREDPGYRGPNAVIAAEYLELTDVSGSR